MDGSTLWSIRTKSEQVVFTDHLLFVLMPEEAVLSAQLAEASLVVRAGLLLLGCTHIFRLGVAIHALFLDVTVSVLLEELTNRNSVLNPSVQILTLITFSTRLFKPVHANLLLPLLIVHLVVERLDDAFDHVDVRSTILDWCTAHSRTFLPVHVEVLTLVLPPLVIPLEPIAAIVLLTHYYINY